MADDDRYRWLDDEAAERLLHGSAVNARSTRASRRPGSDHGNVETPLTGADERPGAPGPSWARRGARRHHRGAVPERATGEELAEDRLAALLDTLVAEQTATLHALTAVRGGPAPGDAGAELPGEAAAVAAFRAAHAGAEHSGTVDISAGPTESGTVVGRRAVRDSGRSARGRRPGSARRGSLMGRPLRAGFAMAVAGCALGGAAVAAGTGVLPTPFGGGGTPAASVSPMVSPGDDEREEAAGGSGSPYDNGPRRGTREGGSPSDSPSGEDLAGTDRGRDGKPSKDPKGDEDWLHGDGKRLSEADKKAMARALCEAYEEDQLSLRYRLRLEAAAGGPAGVKKFCAKHDRGWGEYTSGGMGNAGGVGTPGTPGDSGGSSNGNSGGEDGDSSGGGNSGGDSGGEDSGGSQGGDSGGGDSGGASSGGSTGGAGGSRPDSGGQSGGADGEQIGSGETSSTPSASASPTP